MTTQDITLTSILHRLDAIDHRLNELAARGRGAEELIAEMTPIARVAMNSAITRLDALEKKGYFAWAREAAYVADRIVESYQPEDVRALGDAIVSILDTVRALTQPEVLSVVSEATEVLAHTERAEPIGLVGIVRATRNDEVQKGMAVLMALLGKLGKGASAVAAKKNKKSAAPRPRKRALGVERAPTMTAPAKPACSTPRAPVAATVLDGVAFTADGHVVDAAQWTRELAQNIAATQGVTLTEAHWKVLELARNDFAETKVSPNIRRLTQIAGVSTKELYTLFPKAPGRTIAKIAGLPKPAGCL